jgi:hypothetical protein
VLFSGLISRPELLYKLGLNLNLQEYDVHIFTIAGSVKIVVAQHKIQQ